MRAKAEVLNCRQEEFLSMLAHELRNPLAPIAMAAEFLGTIADAHPMLPNLHDIISRQINHMTHLVDDLVDASRVRNGKVTLQTRTLLLSEIIESAVETSRPFIDKRGQKLSVELPREPLFVEGDLVRLAQVFSNLLINSTKFTPEHGCITVTARKLTDDTVMVSVEDNGVGIAPELQPFIFDLFTQGPRSLERSQGGTRHRPFPGTHGRRTA
jgi:signal transduction histidine kinase